MSESLPWTEQQLSQLANYFNGRAFKPHEWSNKGLAIIRIQQINNPTQITDYYDGLDIEDRHRIRNGDLLFSWSATLRALIWKNGDGVLNQHIFKVVENENVNRKFLQSLLEFNMDRLAESSHGSTMKHIRKGVLDEFLVQVPPLKEQQKIAEILTSVDEVIENTQSQINKLEDLKKATMNELLTKGVGHTEFKETEIGRIPKDWRIRSLEQLVDQNRPITYGIVQTGEHIPDGVPCIRVVDIVRMKPDINRMIRTTHDISNSYRRTILKTDDILFALRGEIGFVYKVNAYLEGANLTRGVALISSSDGVSSNFLVWALRGKLCRQQILDGVNGSALQEIPLGNLRGIKVPVPCEDEQNHIFQVLSSIELRISQTQNTINKVGILKQSLMQDLLTGKVRVSVN